MTLKRDLSDLPTAPSPFEQTAAPGVNRVPDKNPLVGPALAAEWFKTRVHDDNLPLAMPDAGPHRGSDAGKCSRAIGYRMLGTEQSDPPTIADHWRMDLGSMVHAELQTAIEATTPGSISEMVLDLNTVGIPGSMRLDLLHRLDDGRYEACEIKTINGFGFKASATTFKKSGPDGPRESHVLQAALGAAAAAATYDVTGARIVYLSMELVSPDLAANIGLGGEVGRFTAEWFIPLEVCQAIAAREAERLTWLRNEIETGLWIRPLIPITPLDDPRNLKVVNPSTGAAVLVDGTGSNSWACGYCSYKSQCIRDHADRALA